MRLTLAQQRLVDIIRQAGDNAEFWPVVNDWVKDCGPAKTLALRNINRTVETLIKHGILTVDDDGLFHIVKDA